MNRVPRNNGCYKAKVTKNGLEMYSPHPDGKSFFPDEWSEEQIIDAIKEAYNNAPTTPIQGTINSFIGTANGIQILFYKASDGKIISAFPNY